MAILLILFLLVHFLIVCINYVYDSCFKAIALDNFINYEVYLKDFIQVVSKNNYYMNYGLWDRSHKNLLSANENLVNYIIKNCNLVENINILDVGCGYGKQDLKFLENIKSGSKITAIDISKKQIAYANALQKSKNIPISTLEYKVGDALCLNLLESKYDRIISIESAFHYSNRPKFFNDSYEILNNNGLFIISDITLNDNYNPSFINELFLNVFSEFLHIPKQNLIKTEIWKEHLISVGYKILKIKDITLQTFNPYYSHFFKTFIRNKGYPEFISSILISFFYYCQPFSYSISICKKLIDIK